MVRLGYGYGSGDGSGSGSLSYTTGEVTRNPNFDAQHDPGCDCESCFYEARMSGKPDPKGGR